MTVLRGLTWKHDRGLAPMLATAGAFCRNDPEIQITWEARSLHEFGAMALEELTGRYDLFVIDHPHVGSMADSGAFVTLDEYLPDRTLSLLGTDSVAKSFESYRYAGHQWALPIDAAAQVSGYRPDLLEKYGFPVPQGWDEMFALGREGPGLIAMPLGRLDSICAFFSMCAHYGESPFDRTDAEVVSLEVGMASLERLRQLVSLSANDSLNTNPIQIWERMSATDEIGYCPLAFGYSNYARPGYRRNTLRFANIPLDRSGTPRGAVLGGAGLAISRRCPALEQAVAYAAWIAHPDCQSTIYFKSGGQPASLTAWRSSEVNAEAGNFFLSTLDTLNYSYLRPRWDGMNVFQSHAADLVLRCLRGESASGDTIRALNEAYAKCNRSDPSVCRC